MTEITPALQNTTSFVPVQPFSEDGAIATAIFIIPMAVFGILANLVTIIVIARSKSLSKSVFNQLIISLCVSDLFSALNSPLALYRRTIGYHTWILPEFFCKLFWGIYNWTAYATSFHILLFAIIRMISIKWSTKYQGIRINHVKILAFTIWILTFACGFIPMWMWIGLKAEDLPPAAHGASWPDCTLNIIWLAQFQLYSKIAYPIFFYIPMLMISIISSTIALLILKKGRQRIRRKASTKSPSQRHSSKFDRKSQRKENSAIIQLAFIVGSFYLGYIPNSAYMIYTTTTPQTTLEGQIGSWNFGTISYILLRLSECLNPIFYNIASSKMRKKTTSFMKSGLWKCCPATWNVGMASDSTTSSSTHNIS